MNNQCVFLLVCASCAVLVTGQYSDDFDQSPLPPRLAIPGAAPVGRPQFRAQARRFPPSSQLVSDPVPPPPPIKIRRPAGGRAGRLNAGPSQLPQQPQPRPIPIQSQQQGLTEVSIPPRPVIEDPEEQQSIDQQLDAFPDASPTPVINNIPSQLPSQQQSQPQLRPAAPRPSPAVFRPERPPFIPTPTPDLDFPQPTRQQFRAQQAAQQQFQPTPSPPQFSRQQQQQQQQQQQTSSRQQQQLVRNQPQKQQQVQYVKYQDREKDRDREAPPREKKPVAQVLRRYREDNEDGSITWGFENDDGSFKEETIGVDCVTRGKYGYIDPDGVRREYSYSSGIPCDKTRDDNQEAATNEGYIDYQNNRYVLPNGDAIDLDKMVKNRARKPVQLYRN